MLKEIAALSIFSILILIQCQTSTGQSYTSYFTGNSNDLVTSPQGGICLMGGATENDNAMRWFLNRTNGGDVIVLRTSGSDGYNDYFYNQLGVNLNSVETIVFNNASASNNVNVLDRIAKAEGIWFAGGDQWSYMQYWKNSPIDSLINAKIGNDNTVIGGTSAGMAVLGGLIFTAQNGTISSNTALNDPFSSAITLDTSGLFTHSFLQKTITDTHYDNPDRRGRHVAFIANLKMRYGLDAKGIACDEYTAVCIDDSGFAKVYGGFPTYDDNAYFIQLNCAIQNNAPEIFSSQTPLTWNLNTSAIKAYRIQGNQNGAGSFNLNNWTAVSGGTWLDWYVVNGQFYEAPGDSIDCQTVSQLSNQEGISKVFYPNPTYRDFINFTLKDGLILSHVVDNLGRKVAFKSTISNNVGRLELIGNSAGIYFALFELTGQTGYLRIPFIKK